MSEINRETLYYIHEPEILKRKTDQFVGILHGVVGDDEVLSGEVAFLAEWLKKNRDVVDEYPMSAVSIAITRAMDDGYLSPDELEDIKNVIRSIVPPLQDFSKRAELPAAPWDQDERVEIQGYTFCLTGDFISGDRKFIIDETEKKGGIFHKSIKKTTDYLFVGYEGSDMYLHGHFGTKIKRALKFKPKTEIKILTEEIWMNSVISR